MAITDYDVVESATAAGIAELIAARLADDWQPYGPMQYQLAGFPSQADRYAQAMVKGIPASGDPTSLAGLIDALETRMTAAEGAITALDVRVTALEP